jgi:N6-adenosine-specific RNA methylase IME4
VRRLIVAPRREHSRKPDEAYRRVERLVAGPYFELFSRTTRPNWRAWGNETGKYKAIAESQRKTSYPVQESFAI